MSINFKTILNQLRSDRIKERQEGLASLRSTLSRRQAVERLDTDGKGQTWLVVFPALFKVVVTEKTLYEKKPSDAVERRLREAASTVRWLAETVVDRLNRKVVRTLLTQLLEVVVHRGELFAPVALDYIKSIKTIVGFQPHMDYLDDTNWVAILELAFNVVLRDPLRRRLDIDDEDDYSDDSNDPQDNVVDVDMEPRSSTATAQSRKRRRNSSPTPGYSVKSQRRAPVAASNEQVEFASIIYILLRVRSAPLLSKDYPTLASAVLKRLRRFLTIYPTESSLHRDYLLTVSATLSHISLNRKRDVEVFARHSWPDLVDLWGTGAKSPWIKEALVPVFRALFPFLTAAESPRKMWRDGVSKLWYLLDAESENRWGVDGLSLESLRLEMLPLGEYGEDRQPFVASTFRAGWHFDSKQALAWAILELQADCTEQLFLLSESIHTTSVGRDRAEGKRTRLENPIVHLLQSIKEDQSANVRAYHLQILLFFIDRHWSVLHDSFQQDIINLLLQFVSVDDGTIQSWTFLCLAAIAHIDGLVEVSAEAQQSSQTLTKGRSRDPSTWDPIWTHSVRRANVPSICRAACHAAFVLLTHAKKLLTSPRVLLEIETLAKDLDAQGPTFPYDSVCAFLAKCLGVASQDVRLYRIRLEEKVLGWLTENWRLESSSASKSRMALHTVADVLALLEAICGLPNRSALVCRVLPPDCPITDAMVEEADDMIIRDFLLKARIPPFQKKAPVDALSLPSSPSTEPQAVTNGVMGLAEPIGRERKISNFLLKSLGSLILDWESLNNHLMAEKARQAIDMAVIAFAFESLLVFNGTRSNRRVMQAAGKLLIAIVPRLASSKWTIEERALVLLGLDPLTAAGERNCEFQRWQAMVPPNAGTGIKLETLMMLTSTVGNGHAQNEALRRNFQRVIWQDPDVQDAFNSILPTLKDILRILTGGSISASASTMDVDYPESFGSSRTSRGVAELERICAASASRCVVEICVSFLAVVPVLESSSDEPTRDKELTDLVLGCSPEYFLFVAPAFFSNVQRRNLNLTPNNLKGFLDKFASLVAENYTYGRREKVLLLLVFFTRSTLPVWLHENVRSTDVARNVNDFLRWFSELIEKKQARSWKVRDAMARLFDDYLSHDPAQKFLNSEQDSSQKADSVLQDSLPSALLSLMGEDDDIRVRFRVTSLNARLFSVAQSFDVDPMVLYSSVLKHLTKEIDDFEFMLTRILTLGNIVVASSAVRRGPYWHLLEICLHANGRLYHHHIVAVLHAVSERMGLAPSALFEVYASQIAYSIRQAGHDFLQFPPDLLGYKDRRQCAERNFRAFTPTNVLAGGSDHGSMSHGQKLFLNHCRALQKSTAEGLRECFGDIIGIQIVSLMDEHQQNPDGGILDSLEDVLRVKTKAIADFGNFDDVLNENIDGIVAAILRTLSDHDFSDEGLILRTLLSADVNNVAAHTFRELLKHRRVNSLTIHEPNLPTFPSATILPALDWLSRWSPSTQHATTYHVMHELFADIDRSPFVNEQIRLLTALCLWIAIRENEFQNLTLLHTLIQGASSLLAQYDLARAVQSILEWCFFCYRKNAIKDPRFPDVLIRISCLAYDYTRSNSASASELGESLLQWVDHQAFLLCKITTLRVQVSKALAAWPHQPSPELVQIYKDITSETLSVLLTDYSVSANKFRLVRRLQDLAAQHSYGENKFSTADFWRLKACIPPPNQLQDSDVDAFVTLLILNGGRIHSFGSDQNPTQSVRIRHHRAVRKQTPKTSSASVSPQYSIVMSLLAMLDSSSIPQAHMAYRTLRFIISAPDQSTIQFESWPSEYSSELEFLQTYARTAAKRPHPDLNDLLRSEDFLALTNFSEWVCRFAVFLSDIIAASNAFFAHLAPILQCDVEFAEQMLPILIHSLLTSDEPNVPSPRIVVSQYVNHILASDNANISCLRTVVETVLHLRNFQPPAANDALAYDKWLDIDFTLLARKAVTCGAYTTALLFLELAAEYRDPSVQDDLPVEQILFDIYSHIDEPDGFYGIQTNDLRHFLIKRFHHENQWEKAFRFHGAALQADKTDSSAADGVLQSFHAFGFDHLAIDTLQGSSLGNPPTNSGASDMSYQLGWRTETWDLPDPVTETNSTNSLYLALRAIHRERDQSRADTVLRQALSREMRKLRELGSESIAEIHEVTRTLMCLHQITQWRQAPVQERLASKVVHIHEWEDFLNIPGDFEFSDFESIMATRISLIRSVCQKEKRNQIGMLVTPFIRGLTALETRCLVRLSEAARDANQIQIALNSIVRAQILEERTHDFDVSQEFACVLWFQKEQKLAIRFLKDLLHQYDSQNASESSVDETKKALILARLGSWMSKACLEKPGDIVKNSFHPAVRMIASSDGSSRGPSHALVFHQYATFAEHQYYSIINSPDAIRFKMYVDRKTQEIMERQHELTRTQANNPGAYKKLNRVQSLAQAQLKEDQKSFEHHEEARAKFLRQAIDMCSRSLQISDAFDEDATIRLCSMWFANFDDASLQKVVKESLGRVASRKFVFLAHQLSARLWKSQANEAEPNQENLQRLVLRMCREHPFHSLYQVHCLRPLLGSSTRRQSSRLESLMSHPERAAAAQDILSLLRQDGDHGERVLAVEKICDVCLEWAKFPVKDGGRTRKQSKIPIPQNLQIRNIGRSRVPVLTVNTPLDPTLMYEDCVWIDGYEDTFDLIGGVNAPKVMRCKGSDGVRYTQLFKGEGEDDLRQDAVMQQVFELVNIVLRRDRETRKRNLGVRGYKVVPLASQAGIIEFVGNTYTLQEWLGWAHRNYHPTAPKATDLQKKLGDKRDEIGKGSLEPLIALYTDIRKIFKPVMRHFFTDGHKNPITWFATRLNYTRSVATTSIVGHVLGIGDRHPSNMLLDKVTGEIIHIDFGIAFDQGKLLGVPERVPFRLTRDMIDGMGMSGTQGVFQRCAEETLRVLRERSEVIKTVLEVFKHDPLHQWTASEIKVHRVQNQDPKSKASTSTTKAVSRVGDIGIDITSGTADEAADRALSSVARKLDKSLSVEATVNALIAEATDIVNLALIYYGWGPHL